MNFNNYLQRRFRIPATDDQAKIPFARVNHNKYMVTDRTAYIGMALFYIFKIETKIYLVNFIMQVHQIGQVIISQTLPV